MNKGQSDVFVLKYDSLGKLIYRKMIGGTDVDRAYSVCALPSGGIVIAGATRSTDGDFERDQRHTNGIRASDDDAFVVHLDKSGTIVWTRVYSGPREDVGKALAVKNDTTIVLAGNTNSTDDDFNEVNIWSDASSVVFVVEMTISGRDEWMRGFGSNLYFKAIPTALTIGPDASIYLTGFSHNRFDNFPVDSAFSSGQDNLFVLKLTATGNEEWITRCSRGSWDEGSSISLLNNGDVIVAGHQVHSKGIGVGSRNADALVATFNDKGKLLEKRSVGGRGSDAAAALTINRRGHIVLVGSTTAERGDPHNDGVFLNLGKSASYGDAFIIELE